MAQPEQKEGSSSYRWWEFYFMRYMVGTVVGGIIVYLLFENVPTLKPALFSEKNGSLDSTKVVLFAAYGLAYCYIASAPILVFHTGRFLFDNGAGAMKTSACRLAWLFGPPIAVALVRYCFVTNNAAEKLLFAASFFIPSLLIWLQVLAIYRTLSDPKGLLQFYAQLDAKRQSHAGDLIESYKHLREHGNSFAIVVLEIILASIIYLTTIFSKDPSASSTIIITLFVWIAPAAGVWLVGTQLERTFSEDAKSQTRAK